MYATTCPQAPGAADISGEINQCKYLETVILLSPK